MPAINSLPPINASVPTGPATPAKADPAKIEHAAKQFESLLIAQILKSTHESGSAGWLGSGEDQTADASMELAEEQFAQALASRGGLGLSKLIMRGLVTESERAG
jgi:Rod binding domain-containing protein